MQLLGLCQQFSIWVSNLAPATFSLRYLLRKSTAFVWTSKYEAEFQQMKAILTGEGYIKPFDPKLYTELLVDTLKVAGAGYILIQRSQDGVVHNVTCRSISASRSWASMAPIEAEAAGIGCAVNHCGHYLTWSDKMITVVTDHFSLVAGFGKSVFDLSQRLWNVQSLLMGQRLEVKWIPGKQQDAAGALGPNLVWPGAAENSGEGDGDSSCEEAYYFTSEYRGSRVYEDELCD